MSRTGILIVAATACLMLAAVPKARAQRGSRPRSSGYSDFLRRGVDFYDPLMTPFLPRRGSGIERRSSGGPATSPLIGGDGSSSLYYQEVARAAPVPAPNRRQRALRPLGPAVLSCSTRTSTRCGGPADARFAQS